MAVMEPEELEHWIHRAASAGIAAAVHAIGDQAATEALDAIARREQTYARQRSEAMALRFLNALDRHVLQQDSPLGAFWKRNRAVLKPFPDSLVMDGHFVPWSVLADFHPPTHPLDHCTLHSRAEALAKGWLRPENDLTEDQARALVARARAANASAGWRW